MEFRLVPAGRYNLQKNRLWQNEELCDCKGLFRRRFFPVCPMDTREVMIGTHESGADMFSLCSPVPS